jgi:drug/metabolite transporter (DMT)-like permease
MAALRHAIAGALLYGWLSLRGAARPSLAEWRSATIVGVLLLCGGNGLVTWAEQWIPSGLTALLIASVPLWMGVMQWTVEPTARPGARGIAGILLGFGGVGILVNPRGAFASDPAIFLGAIGCLCASASWAAGSLYSRRATLPKDPLRATAMQMLAGGAALAVVGTFTGEWGRLDLGSVSLRSALAVGYLIVFGSIVAFSAYIWILRVSTPAKVATYAYVNPIVAVFLGWAFAGESVTSQTIAAAAIIVASVAMITTERAVRREGVSRPRRGRVPREERGVQRTAVVRDR